MTRPSALSRAAAAVAAAALVATAQPLAPAAAEDSAPRRIVAGWMPYWTTAESLAAYTANSDVIGEISPFWYSTTWSSSKGTSVVVNPYAPSQVKNGSSRAALVAQLKAGGAKVIPSVVDATGSRRLAAVLADGGTRGRLVQQLVDLAVSEGYDGIDIDYEGFAFSDGRDTWSSTRPNWVAFMTELGAALHARGKVLTTAVPPQCNTSLTNTACGGSNGYWVYDFVGIAPAVDRIRIMAYDYSYSVPGPIAPYPWVEAIAAYYASQVPATKVQIGAPTYGRDWVRRTSGGGYDLSGSCPSSGTSAYSSIVKATAPDAVDIPALLAANGNPPVTYDPTYRESTFRYNKKTTWTDSDGSSKTCTARREVWFDGAASAMARTELVGKYGLGGIAFWTIGGEDPAMWAPIRAYAQGLGPASTTVGVTHPGTAVYGAPVSVTATASAAGAPVAGAEAKLFWRALGARKWTSVGAATTGPDGVAAFTVTPTASGTWRVRVARTATSTSVNTGAVGDTRLRAKVVAAAPATATPGASVALRGRVAPKASGVKVRVQAQEGSAWRTVARARTNAKGRVRTDLTAPATAGAYAYRVKAAKTSTTLAGTSAPVTLTVG